MVYAPAAAAAAPPSVTPLIYGTGGANGWFTSDVTVNWNVQSSSPYTSSGCDGVKLTAESAGASVTCSATNADGTTTQTVKIKIDKTPPSTVGNPSRPADANGWYNHALSVAFSGTDATSGVAGCSAANYAGPDNPNLVVAGSCTDNAGNVGTGAFPLKYDATPPTLKTLKAKAGNRRFRLSWVASADTSVIRVLRSSGARGVKSGVVYSGKAHTFRDSRLKVGARYRYTVVASDDAGNSTSKTIKVVAAGRLFAPLPGQAVSRPPLLSWTPVKGAAYYNVQLVRGKKILSAWPRSTHFRVPRSWVYQGHRYRLHRGVYRWYIWPGFGTFSANRYGSVLGGSSFVFSP